jgi:hypothetical protein
MKYPRTYHMPSSPGTTNDDKKLSSLDHFEDLEVVITVKMDGENTSLYRDHIHARSEDSLDHPSRHWIKNLHGKICFHLPENTLLCGENLYAKHSIHYTNLRGYFYLFSVWDTIGNFCLPWDHTVAWAHKLDIPLVPVLYKGLFDYNVIRQFEQMTTYDGDEMEGFVIRRTCDFSREFFTHSVAKYVRANHVQTDDHWMYQQIVRNELRHGY